MSMLSEILATKRTEVCFKSKKMPFEALTEKISTAPPIRDFRAALENCHGSNCPNTNAPAIIAEVKKASPSKGVIRENFEPVEIAKQYAANGASCLSVLTDEVYFQGHLNFLTQIREEVNIPILRKDFMVDPWQILESRIAGADAILLIVAALSPTDLRSLKQTAESYNLSVLVEVHDQSELDEALNAGATLIGINNRDLHTFRSTLSTTLDLMTSIPDNPDIRVVSESGIFTHADILKLKEFRVHAALVGEALMREADVGAKLRELISGESG